MSSKICNRCVSGLLDKEIDVPLRLDPEGNHVWDHYRTFNELETSSLKCLHCLQLLELGPSRILGSSKSLARGFCFVANKIPGSGRSFRFSAGTNAGEHRLSLLVCYDGNQPYSHELKRLAEEPIWTADGPLTIDQRLQLFQKLYTLCREKHVSCSWHQTALTLPTRLIEIPSDETVSPRLVESHGMKSVAYTTLSHRWGDEANRPLRTLLNNVDQHKLGIPLNTIPKTFIDAITITRMFGIQYLWIDALCIIQDSTSDWQHEAARMSDVYSGSSFSIAAIDASDANGGCFPGDIAPPLKFQVPAHSKELIRVRFIKTPIDDVSRSVILTRGWVFQEVELAPRILYCGSSKFLWQCATHMCSEDGVYFAFPIPFHLWHQMEDQYSKWWSMMQFYSQLNFTYESDRLPALAGITLAFQRRSGLAPFLGWWKEHLVEGLNWGVFHAVKCKRSDIPSWSWLSLGCKANINFNTLVDSNGLSTAVPFPCLSILRASVEWEGPEFVSGLKSSELVLRGFLFQIEVDQTATSTDLNIPIQPTWQSDFHFHHDIEGVPDLSLGPVQRRCLFLCFDRTPGPESTVRLYFLVLEPKASNLSSPIPQYHRIGHGTWEFVSRGFEGSHLDFLAKVMEADISDLENDLSSLRPLERIFRSGSVDIELV